MTTLPEAFVGDGHLEFKDGYPFNIGDDAELASVRNELDGTEVNSLAVYNGKLYGGSLPRAEFCRCDGTSEWTSLKRFYSPEGWQPGKVGKSSRKEVNAMCRLTSLTVYDGKLFASTGSCTSSALDAPADFRRKVFNIEAGKVASYDDDLGPRATSRRCPTSALARGRATNASHEPQRNRSSRAGPACASCMLTEYHGRCAFEECAFEG